MQGNFAGTDISGNIMLGNNGDGLRINDAPGNTIRANLFSGNGANGVIFKTSQGSTNLYIPETGAAAPTEVDCHGGAWFGYNDDIVVGYNPHAGGRGRKTVKQSTLAYLRSSLTVHGAVGNAPPPSSGVLEVDDETGDFLPHRMSNSLL